MKKWTRAVVKVVPARVEVCQHRGHYRLVCRHCGTVITTCSGSPKNAEHALQAVKRDVARYIVPHLNTCLPENDNGSDAVC